MYTIVLEFDHLSNKTYNVSSLIIGRSISTIEREIEKCQVLCSNCHRRKTAIEQNWKMLLLIRESK
jgi:hypothetical protein